MAEVDVETEVRAFEADIRAVRAQARRCVERFRATTDEDVLYLFAERLGALGSMVVPDLCAVVLDDGSATPAQRYLAAWVIVRAGDRGRAVDHLLAEVGSGSSYALASANALARAGLAQGIAPVTDVLLQMDRDRTSELVPWATALLELGGTLPPEVRAALEERSSDAGAAAVLALANRS